MKERPILMHARSIKGILEGRKTQTRRIIKNPPAAMSNLTSELATNIRITDYGIQFDWLGGVASIPLRCHYGIPGDRLWVRETWQQYRENSPEQREAIIKSIARIQSGESTDIVAEVLSWPMSGGEWRVLYAADFGDWAYDVDSDLKPWKPSIHMFRRDSRITLEVTDVRVERVQDISDADCEAEGVRPSVDGDGHDWLADENGWHRTFRQLWNDTNGKGAWDRNDWCWVVDFRRIDAHSRPNTTL